jgi:hypothetical protein
LQHKLCGAAGVREPLKAYDGVQVALVGLPVSVTIGE